MFSYFDIMSLDEAIGNYYHPPKIKTVSGKEYYIPAKSKLELKLVVAMAVELGYMQCLVNMDKHIEKRILVSEIPEGEILRLIDEICT
jgi:hypothetical protein